MQYISRQFPGCVPRVSTIRISWILSGPVSPYYYILSTNVLFLCVLCWFYCNTFICHKLKVSPGQNIFYSWIPKSFLLKTCKFVCYLAALLSVCFDSSGQPDIQFIHSDIYIYIYIYGPCPLKGFDIGGFDHEESGRIICYGIMSVSWVSKDDTWKPIIFLNAEFVVLNLQVIIYASHQGRRQESHRILRWNVRIFPWPMSQNAACFCWRRLSRDYWNRVERLGKCGR
jgi:hypothetical protein